ncbi:hypothetical protein EVAR_2467_1 [Eumeta japonica]|uniref:Uncharacterized protein n=1 Tax=Eumeta variegata TaxID=151549 RepID=A0A4C1SNS1_EUMVA|nr:hypothetical protein EVAR_2467_1 [Eumeta japonica]
MRLLTPTAHLDRALVTNLHWLYGIFERIQYSYWAPKYNFLQAKYPTGDGSGLESDSEGTVFDSERRSENAVSTHRGNQPCASAPGGRAGGRRRRRTADDH